MRYCHVTALLLCALAASANATLLQVPSQYGTIQAAINAATTGDEVVLAAGTYYENVVINSKDITLRSVDISHQNSPMSTVIDGNDAGPVVTVNGPCGNNCRILALGLRNGTTLGSGGGICLNNGASPTIMYNRIMDNTANGPGGGLAIRTDCSPYVADNYIAYNSGSLGGGIYTVGGGTVFHSTVNGNTATSGAGVMCGPNCTTNFEQNNILNGSASVNGGGVLVEGNAQSIFKHNRIHQNSAAFFGGAVVASQNCNVVFANNTFVYNSAGTACSGIYAYQSTVNVHSSIFAFGDGAAFLIDSSTVTVNCCDVYDNSGDASGPVVSSLGTGNISKDPLFANLAVADYHLKSAAGHWDETTQTYVADAVTSPCLDAGLPTADCSSEPQRNGARIDMGCYANDYQASRSPWSLLTTVTPNREGKNVSCYTDIILNFRWDVDMTTVPGRVRLLDPEGKALASTLEWLIPKKQVRFHPTLPLKPLKTYMVKVVPGMCRTSHQPIGWTEKFTFTTRNQPLVVSWTPKGSSVITPVKIKVTFDRLMNHAATEAAFSTVPASTGTFAWVDKQMVYTPSPKLLPGQDYTVTIGATAASATGLQMRNPFTWSFHTGTPPTLQLAAAAIPTAQGAQFSVRLSQAADVEVQITNLAGRAVAMLPARELAPGPSALLWNGKSATGTRLPAGRYLALVTARTASGAQARACAALNLSR